MNNSNRTVFWSIALVASLGTLGLSSCNSDEFLDVEPKGVLTEEGLGSIEGINGMLVGVYSQLNGRSTTGDGGLRVGGTDNWVHGSIRGGDANKGTDPGDFPAINPVVSYSVTAQDDIPRFKWEGNFDGVVRANTALTIIRASQAPGVDGDFRNNAIGQARFLRAHYYFNLTTSFLNVPFFDETVLPNDVVMVPNTVNWDAIEADFQAAVDSLPATQDAPGKVNRWAAMAYLAKTHMFQGDYAAALPLLNDVIENGVTSDGQKYALLDEFSKVFNAEFDNSSESLFAIQAAANTGTVSNANRQWELNFPHNTGEAGPGNCCGFYQPSFDMVSSFRTTEDGLPLLDGSYRQDANQVLNDFEISFDDPSYVEDPGPLDPRLDHTAGRRGIPYLDWGPFPGSSWIRNPSNGGPFATKKFIYYKAQEGTLSDGSSWTRGYSSMNYNVIRFADVLLLAAESEIETDGDLERARELINTVRTRAANPDGFVKKDDGSNAANYVISNYDAFSNQEEARQAVRFERKLELAEEGHRFFDLVRWGTAAEFIPGYINYERQFLDGPFASAEFNVGKDEYYPIPQIQIDLQQGVLTQNPGY